MKLNCISKWVTRPFAVDSGNKYMISQLSENNRFSSQDPSSNTGSNSQQVSQDEQVQSSIDHITLLWQKNESATIYDNIQVYLGVYFDTTYCIGRKIGVWWDRNYSSPCGCIYSERYDAVGGVHCRLSISGTACRSRSTIWIVRWLKWCYKNLTGVRVSRLDVAVDDYCRKLDVNNIRQALEDHNYSGFKDAKITENYGNKYGGWTASLGCRQSEKYVRIYDKYAESKGLYDCIRFEVEFSGGIANNVMDMILECPEDGHSYHNCFVDVIASCVTFIHRKDKNIQRNELLEWWKDWIVYIKGFKRKIRTLVRNTSIIKKRNWIGRAVAKSMSLIIDAIGLEASIEYIMQAVAEARNRYTNYDELLIAEYKRGDTSEMGVIMDAT